MMRKFILLFFLATWLSDGYAQYTATDDHTAEELADELTGDGLVMLNPVLSCGDSVNGIYSGTGGLGFNSGIVLSTGNIDKVFQPYDWGYVVMTNVTTPYGIDEDMNNYLSDLGYSSSELYAACVLEMDIVPQAATVTMDYIYATGDVQWLGAIVGDCEFFVDYFTVLIKGGSEYPEYKNIATIPDTEIPVTAMSIKFAGTSSCPPVDGGPYTEYYVGTSTDMMEYFNYDAFTTVFSPTAEVTPCDTYHIKMGIADIRLPGSTTQSISSSLFLKSGSLRTIGQPVDCPTADTTDTTGTGIHQYIAQQQLIHITPNPFINDLSISIDGNNGNEYLQVTLTDIQGRLLKSVAGKLGQVNNKLNGVGSNLARGMYYLNIRSDSGKLNYTVKVLKE